MFHRSRILTICSFVGVMLFISLLNVNQQPIHAEEHSVQEPLTVKVILKRKYLDGEISEEVTKETILSMKDFWAEYKDWQLLNQEEDRVVFQKNIDDISPLLKTNGYFGIAGDGTLTIFNGKPKTNEVIQSFFQLDVEKLESRKHDELKEGIRIQSKDQYLEVLQNLQYYSKTEKQ
ncbi:MULTISPECIES: intercompartmental signaling factor BofC [Bacillaceae]|uniref:BofC C-terminal domain-containing protein n=2 Tax=Bacillaceae TaxID=186817 RepID=A0ABW5BUJ9_9BACI|nr:MULTISPECIES: intercompartmental signaling factor BofC [Bacillaceae]MCM3413100.1 intercompartmental signaling factor BofC [Metabacillus litoralis]PGT80631.1 regulator [Bacillus sp. AFS040349]